MRVQYRHNYTLIYLGDLCVHVQLDAMASIIFNLLYSDRGHYLRAATIQEWCLLEVQVFIDMKSLGNDRKLNCIPRVRQLF